MKMRKTKVPTPAFPLTSARLDLALIAVLVAAYLSPIWFLDYFGTQDGPAHVDSASVLARLHLEDSQALRAVYDSSFRAIPNLTAQLGMAALALVVDPEFTEKLLLTLYMLLFAWGMSLTLTAADRRSHFLWFLGFPLAYPWYLNKGFYSYSLGVVFCLLLATWWFRTRDSLNTVKGIALAVSLVGLYFTHAAVLAVALIILTMISAGETFVAWSRQRSESPSEVASNAQRSMIREFGFLLVSFAPALLLLFLFVAATATESPDLAFPELQLWRARALSMRYLLVSYSDVEYFLAPVFAFILMTLATIGLFRRIRSGVLREGDSFLACAFVLSLMCLVVPGRLSGGQHLFSRLLVFPVLMLLAWLSTIDWSRSQRRLIRWTGIVYSLLFLGVLVSAKSNLQPFIHEFVSVQDHLESDSRFLTVNLSPELPHQPRERSAPRVRTFLHLSGYLAAETGAIDLSNYQGWTGHFPLLWRPEANPFRTIPTGPDASIDEVLNFLRRKDIDSVDFLLVWNLETDATGQGNWSSIEDTLRPRFDVAVVSQPNGWAHLFRRKPHNTLSTTLTTHK